MNTQLYADSFFSIGADHLRAGIPCQDYADHAATAEYAWAVLADGCSTSKYSDIGARILVQLAQELLLELCTQNEVNPAMEFTARELKTMLHWRILSELNHKRKVMGLQGHDGLATLSLAVAKDNKALILMHGDGTYAIKYRNGELEFVQYEYKNNAPLYPQYHYGGMNDYIAMQGGITQKILTETKRREEDYLQKEYQLWEVNHGIVVELENLEEIEAIAVFSDGIDTFQDTAGEKAVHEMLDFKNSAGAFAKRRMMKKLRTARKNDAEPLDDISYAVIHMGKGE